MKVPEKRILKDFGLLRTTRMSSGRSHRLVFSKSNAEKTSRALVFQGGQAPFCMLYPEFPNIRALFECFENSKKVPALLAG